MAGRCSCLGQIARFLLGVLFSSICMFYMLKSFLTLKWGRGLERFFGESTSYPLDEKLCCRGDEGAWVIL